MLIITICNDMQWRINHCCHSSYCCCCYHQVEIKWNEWNQQYLQFDWVSLVVVIVVANVVVAFVAICNTFVFSHCTHCLSLLLLLLLPTTHATNQQEKRKNGTQIIWAKAPQQQQPAEASAATRAAVKVTHLLWQRLWLPLPAATGRKLQAVLALALVSSSYRCDCCVWRVPRTMLDYRVSRDIAISISCRFFWFCVFILYLIYLFVVAFFLHTFHLRWARTFLKHCVCVTTSVIGGAPRAEGVGRVAPGADVNVDDGKAPLGSSDCTRAAETNETMWMRDQSQS